MSLKGWNKDAMFLLNEHQHKYNIKQLLIMVRYKDNG